MATSNLSDDWQTSRGVLLSNKYMLDNQIETDTRFILENTNGSREVVQAHKYVLISRSPVFFAMLSGPMAERKDEAINVPDIAPDVFKQLLSYIYCEEVELSAETALPLIYAAKKYMMPSLVTKCVDFLESTLSTENVCSVLEQSLLFDEDTLKQKCMRMIQSRSQYVFDSAAFLKMSQETLDSLLQCQSFSVGELEVFQACMKWSEHQCEEEGLDPSPDNKRECLKSALYHLHLPSLSIREFSNHVTTTGILSMEEAFNIFQYLAADEANKPTDIPFPLTPRRPLATTGPLKCHFRFDSKLDALYKKHSIVMINLDRKVKRLELGLSFLPQTAGCVGRIVIGQDNNTINLPYDSTIDKVVAEIELFPGNFVIENYITQMRFRVGLPKFAMLLTRVECEEGIDLAVVTSDAFSVLPATIELTVDD